MSERRRYSDIERAEALAALAANAGNVARTARELSIPRGTLEDWANGSRHPEAAANAAPKKAELSERLDRLAEKLVGAAPGKIKKAGLRDVMVAAGIAIEKANLLKGKPTSITRSVLPIDLTRLNDDQLSQLDAILVAAGLPPADRAGAAAP